MKSVKKTIKKKFRKNTKINVRLVKEISLLNYQLSEYKQRLKESLRKHPLLKKEPDGKYHFDIYCLFCKKKVPVVSDKVESETYETANARKITRKVVKGICPQCKREQRMFCQTE